MLVLVAELAHWKVQMVGWVVSTATWRFLEQQQVADMSMATAHLVYVRRQKYDINHLKPNDHYSGHTAPLTPKLCILYIYSTNIGTEYVKHGIHSPFLSLQNAVCFIILTYLVPVLFTFYLQCVLK